MELKANAMPPSPPSIPAIVHARSSARSEPVVLLVDDWKDNRDLYAECLQHVGLRVVEAIDGFEALVKAVEDPPDVIVMDLSMPNMDGWEAIRRLKADDKTRSIPIIVLTGYGLGGHHQASNAGCDAYLVKPCLPDDLVGVVRSVLDARQ